MVKVIIIGGGFGGINVAKALKKAHLDILLLDCTNHHVFQPLLYQVATAALSVDNIASPIREILRGQANIEVLMAKVERIDKVEQKIYTLDGASFFYDFLVVAPGAQHSYFGHDQWETYAPGLKTIADSIRIREKILLAFEKAERCPNLQEAQKYLRFAIIGAGPTGVEMAGSIAEFAHRTLFKNFHHINPATSKIYLIEGANQILPSFPPRLAEKAEADLKKLGVDILLNTFVTNVTAEGVYMGDQFLPTLNVIWAAGNQASSLLKTLEIPLDKQGRAIVNLDLTIPNYSNIFIIGDAACCLDAQGQPLPAIAPVAIQQGRYVAKIIKKNLLPQQRKPFIYFDKGTIATIGSGEAVAMIRKLQFSGLIAWFIWCFVHILYLVSFRSRLLVMMQWTFLYLLGRRQGRVLTQSIDNQTLNKL
jgi:NADH dehydrogenase